MLKALKPNESIYDITKLYKRISQIKIKKIKRNLLNKISLPKLKRSQLLEQDLSKSISISNKNSIKIHKIQLNYNNNTNIQNTSKNINNTNIYERNNFLSENNKNLILPKVSEKKNYFSENNSPEKVEKTCNFLYLKYEGENYNSINNKIYIKIFPHKIINSITKILEEDKDMINNLEQNVIKMVDKYTTTSCFNNCFNTDYNGFEIDLNEIINSEENKYIILTQNENRQNQPLFRIKNIFLENIIQNVFRHSIEIINEKNKTILKADIENEFMNQIELLKNFFNNEIKNKSNKINNKNVKMINTKKNLLKTQGKLLLSNFEENESYINNITNKKNDLFLTERNKGNFELFNLFKNKLGISQSFHNLYFNILTNNNNSITHRNNQKEKDEINLNKNEKGNNISKQSKLNVIKFYKKYLKIKDDFNICKNEQQEKMFDLKPNIKFVSFDEVNDEIDKIKQSKKDKDTNHINNTNLFLLMMSDDSIKNKINFKNIKNNSIFKMFLNANKHYIINKKEIKSRKAIDVLKKLGKKLHRKMYVKIGINRNKKNLNQQFEHRTIHSSKKNYDESSDTYKHNRTVTEDKFILNETNSSLFSDIPSDLTMSLSEMKREKEENIKKIKKILENRDQYDLDDTVDIFDLDEFLSIIKPGSKKNINIDENNSQIIDKIKEKIKYKIKDKNIFSRNIVDINKNNEDNMNITNELIKDNLKKKQIKVLHINRDLENIKSKIIKDENGQKKLIINKNESESKKNISKIPNKGEKINIKNVNKEKKEMKEIKDIKEIKEIKDKNIDKEINEMNKDTKREKSKSKKTNRIKRTRKITIQNEPDETENNSGNNYDENDLEKDEKEISYKQLMILFNDKFNIPGKKRNHIRRKYSNDSYPINLSYLNTINDIEKKKLIRNKSFYSIKIRNDRKLILLRPPLRHILKKKNNNIKDLKEPINRLFSLSNANLLDINIDSKKKEEAKNKKNKEMISYDYYGNYEHYKNHRILMEKFFGSRKKIEKNYLQDDNDLLLDISNEPRKKYVKRKAVRRRGFRDFMNDDDMLQNNQLSIDYFDNRRKENDKIRSIIEKERMKKKKKLKESEIKFNKFKSYINKLKHMTEEQLRYDTIGFIFKIEADPENIKLSNKVNRINGFKKYIKNNEMVKLNNNESILQNVLFQSNCVFYTDKISKA